MGRSPAFAGSSAGGGMGYGMGGGMGAGMGGFAQFIGGLTGNSGAPYEEANDAYQGYANKAANAQNPFYNAGVSALDPYNSMLGQMSHPSDFINNLMGQYQESPWVKYSQQQGMRAAKNIGSAYGLTGSTPLQMQAQQNAQGISSQDMQNWLGHALGVNNQALSGYGNLVNGGQNSANALSDIYNKQGQFAGESAYGRSAGQNQDWSNMIGGLGQLGMAMFL